MDRGRLEGKCDVNSFCNCAHVQYLDWCMTMKVTLMLVVLIFGAFAAVFFTMSGGPDSRAIAAEKGKGKVKKAKGKANRLAKETSPYLLQHAHNPVDWYPWGKEAFAKAKKENKPIFLSVGYSTCHWCHVMAHESFEDEEVAKVLNKLYVCIKVDREELPDVDAQYMLATQLLTRRGGWPNSVWLMPDGRPWFAGTYFPKKQFIEVLKKLHEIWTTRKKDVEQNATQITDAIKRISTGGFVDDKRPLSPRIVDAALRTFRSRFDSKNGGFGGAPKFPPHGVLKLMLHHQAKSSDLNQSVVISRTLDGMMQGGVYDHLAGGFHRYSTDGRWFLPHFEKMLYDNAQLIRNYSEAYALTKHEPYKHLVAEIFAWLKAEMLDKQGGFYSAVDADSEGEEGKFYVWHIDEIAKVLGEDDAKVFNEIYGVVKEGNFLEESTRERVGTNVLSLSQSLAKTASERKMKAVDLRKKLIEMRAKLLTVRNKRIRPHLDDKVLTSWNGLMIGALARAGKVFKEEAYTKAAEGAAAFVLKELRKDGRLHRTYRKGNAKLPGYLDDYAYLSEGLLDLYDTTGDKRWLKEAKATADMMIKLFYDAKGGGFFFTHERHDNLITRGKDLGGGGNIPNPNGVAAGVLVRLAVLTKEKSYGVLAAKTFDTFAPAMWAQPHANESLILALAKFYEAADKLPSPPRTAFDHPVVMNTYLSHASVKPGQPVYVAVQFKIEKGWHIYGNKPGNKISVPTSVILEKTDAVEMGKVDYPKAKPYVDASKNRVLAYEGTVFLLVPVVAKKTGDVEFKLKITSQACDDTRCLDVVTKVVAFKFNVSKDAKPTLDHAGIFNPLGIK